jgi:hypothetical protein
MLGDICDACEWEQDLLDPDGYSSANNCLVSEWLPGANKAIAYSRAVREFRDARRAYNAASRRLASLAARRHV